MLHLSWDLLIDLMNLDFFLKMPTRILLINNFKNLLMTSLPHNMKLMCGKRNSPSSTKPLAILHPGIWPGCFLTLNFHFGR